MEDNVTNYKDALSIATEINNDLSDEDFSMDKRCRIISVDHYDGSHLEFHGAFCKKIGTDWIAIFTEHHGTHVYHCGDLYSVKEYFAPKSLLIEGEITE